MAKIDPPAHAKSLTAELELKFYRMSLKNLTQDIKKCAEEIKIKKKKKEFPNFFKFKNILIFV